MTTADHSLMLALNFDGGAFWDAFFWHISAMWEWIPLYALILWMIWRRAGWRRMLLALGFIVLAVAAGDQIANFFKQNLSRLRPSRTPELEGMIHTVYGHAGGMYGTVSAHAATAFAIAVFAAREIRSHVFTAFILVWALAVCYSRIYLGLHFPLDLLYGAVDGTLMGLLAHWGYRRTAERLKIS